MKPIHLFKKFLASGTTSELEVGKKLAIQMANFDALLTFLTVLFYTVDSVSRNYYPLNLIHPFGLIAVTMGFLLIRYRYYDTGRVLIHLNGLFLIFLSADAYTENSGYEYYYFTSLMIPFVTFSMREQKKGIILSVIAAIVLAAQFNLGTGLIVPAAEPLPGERAESLFIVISYLLAVLAVARWQLTEVQNEILKQQSELVHSANLIALGEMSSGIAHEINNPLQALTFQTAILKREIEENNKEELLNRISIINKTIFRISKMIKGLKDLSRDDSNDPPEIFSITDILEDVMGVSQERLKSLGVNLIVKGDVNTVIKGHAVQISQVLLNLLNNSIDALKPLSEKWIRIEVMNKGDYVRILVMDSGRGIPHDQVDKIMKPFFTTKAPSAGTGLGLSISKNIIEKNGGKLSYDKSSPYTCFIVELPLSISKP